MSRPLLVVALLAVTGPLVACGGGDGDEPAALVEGVTVDVVALDNVFRPETITVEAGTEIVWTNRGRDVHNVVPEDDADGFRVDTDAFGPGDVYRSRFTETGTFRYYCSIHGTIDVGMIGTVEVVAPEGGTG